MIADPLPAGDGKKPDSWPLPSFDARDWAKEFCRIYEKLEGKPIDEGWMISWFSNALMRGFDEARHRQMKENVPTPETVKTPPPLTPKNSLSEVETIKERASRDISYDESRNHIHRLLVIIDEYDEQLAKESRFWSQSCAHLSQENKDLKAQLRRKDEALERIIKLSEPLNDRDPTEEIEIARAALADGKEGQQKKELEACQWCKKLVSHLIQITDQPDKHDARICEDCYSKEFPEVDGKEGGR